MATKKEAALLRQPLEIFSKNFTIKPIVLKKLPKRACPELAEGFNRSFIVSSSSPTKLWLN